MERELLKGILNHFDITESELAAMNRDEQEMVAAKFKAHEFEKCAGDPAYFIKSYCYVPHQSKGEILMGNVMYPKQEQFIELMASPDPKHRLLITNKTRQCLTKDNYVMTDRGYFSIKDVKIGDKIETIVDGNSAFVDVLDSFSSGRKKTCRILTNSGAEINCTFDHKIFTKRGWIEAGDITLKDEISSIINTGNFGKYSLRKDEHAALIGYYLADGRSNSPTFVNTNVEYINEVLNAGKTFEGCNPYIYKRKHREDRLEAYDVRLVSGYRRINQPFMKFMNEFGLNMRSEKRHLTNNLMNLNREQMSILINRLYAGDGWITHNKDARRKNYIQYEIGFGSPSFQLIKQLEYILQTKYGIHGYISKHNDKRNPESDFWKFRIGQKRSVLKFVKEIGIKGKTDTDKIVAILADEKPYESHQSFEKVRRIEDKQREEDVYDITTESSDFLANGLLVHNCGFSTAIGLFCLWFALFHRNRNIVVVSITDKHSKEFLQQYVHYPYERLPKWLSNTQKGQSYFKNMHELEVYTGSKISCQSGPNAARGMANSIVVVDEIGFYQESVVQNQWSSIYPTTVTGKGKIILNSTSSSAGTWYHTMWLKSTSQAGGIVADKNENDFFPFEVDYWDVPHLVDPESGGDPNYADNMRRNMTPETKYLREILREFVVDEAPFIPLQYTERMREDEPIRADFLRPENVVQPSDPESLELPAGGVDFHKNYVKGLWIWSDPIPKHKFLISCDVAEGSGADYSTIQVLDTTTCEQVAEYQGKVDTHTFSTIVMKVAFYYNYALVIVEANSMGNTVVSRVVNDFKYENIYMRPLPKNEYAAGFKTTTGNRKDVLNAYYSAIVQKGYKTHSARLKKETRSLVTIRDKVQGAQGTNDDLIMAFAIGAYLMEEHAIMQHFYDIKLDEEMTDEELLMQSPEEIKNYLEQNTEYEIDNSSYYQYHWMY